jgi:hypothetical protein
MFYQLTIVIIVIITLTHSLLYNHMHLLSRRASKLNKLPIQSILKTTILSQFLSRTMASSSSDSSNIANAVNRPIDSVYPGTAVVRMNDIRNRVRSLTTADLSNVWEETRRKILWAGGLRDLPNSRPGAGYTGHSFNDYKYVTRLFLFRIKL